MIIKKLLMIASILCFCNSAYSWNLSALDNSAEGVNQADQEAAQLEALQQQNQMRAIQFRQMQ